MSFSSYHTLFSPFLRGTIPKRICYLNYLQFLIFLTPHSIAIQLLPSSLTSKLTSQKLARLSCQWTIFQLSYLASLLCCIQNCRSLLSFVKLCFVPLGYNTTLQFSLANPFSIRSICHNLPPNFFFLKLCRFTPALYSCVHFVLVVQNFSALDFTWPNLTHPT